MRNKLLSVVFCLCSVSLAEYTIKIDISDKLNINKIPTTPIPDEWELTTPLYGNYVVKKPAYDCNNWAPAASTVSISTTFQQNASNCKVDQERTVQAQERNKTTGIVRAIGSPTVESNTLNNQVATRNYTIAMSQWVVEDSTCDSWTPEPLSLPANQTNVTEQTQTCNENKSRTRSESFVDNESSQIVHVPDVKETEKTPTTQSRSVNESFNCQTDTTGDDWNVYMSFKDGSGEYALMEDMDFSNPNTGNYQFAKNTEYKESPDDTRVYIFYKGNFVETRNYYAKMVDVYQVCTRQFQWD